jgi:hypothetical protein
MEKEINCCGLKMRHTKLGYYECSKCGRQVDDELGVIKKTLEAHPNCNAIDLARLTGISSKTILDYMEDGTLTPTQKQKKNIKGHYVGKYADPKWHIDTSYFKN